MANEANYVQEGDLIDYTPVADVAAGEVVDLGTFIGVADRPIPANTTGGLNITGVYDFLKFTGEAIGIGDRVYWDEGTNTATKTLAYSEAIIGPCVKVAAAGDARVRVKLTPGVS